MGGVPHKISRIIELINYILCSCSVSIEAEIGDGTVFYHRGIGCVVHPKAIIGEDCKIFQGVTIGSKWSGANCLGEAPRIGNNVMIGAGAVILGNISIGDNVIIGANAVVTHSKFILQKISNNPSLNSVHQYTHQSIIQPLITPTLRSASGQGERPRVPDAPKIEHDKMKQFYMIDMERKRW